MVFFDLHLYIYIYGYLLREFLNIVYISQPAKAPNLQSFTHGKDHAVHAKVAEKAAARSCEAVVGVGVHGVVG